MPFMLMEHAVDPREKLLKDIGNIDDIEIFNNQLLCAVYIRPEKTKSGLHLTEATRDEDRHQSKVGLVLKMGATAFDAEFKEKFSDIDVKLGDWLYFRTSDGWNTTVNGVLCRILTDTSIRGRVQHPDQIW